jgi:uncharacterized protein (AIM24 family)
MLISSTRDHIFNLVEIEQEEGEKIRVSDRPVQYSTSSVEVSKEVS